MQQTVSVDLKLMQNIFKEHKGIYGLGDLFCVFADKEFFM